MLHHSQGDPQMDADGHRIVCSRRSAHRIVQVIQDGYTSAVSAYLHAVPFLLALLVTMLWPAAPAHAWGILLSRDGVAVEMTKVNALFIMGEDSTTVHLKTHFAGASEDVVWLVPVPSTSKVELSHNYIFERLDEETPLPFYDLLPRFPNETWSDEVIKERFGFIPDLPELTFENERNEECDNLAYESYFPHVSVNDCFGCPIILVASMEERETLSATIIKAQSPSEIAAWVADRGYEVDRLNEAILQSYLEEDHAILAVEVTPPAYLEHLQWVNQLQPIAFTYAGDAITAPLQLVASAGSISGKLTVWIAAEHRAIPENYLHVHLNQARLSWMDVYGLFSETLPSNYDGILSEAIAEAGHHAFSTEYAAERAARTDLVESSIDLESLRNPENLGAFMRDLKGMLPQGWGGRPRGQLDLKLLQLLRQHIPIPDAVIEEIKREYNEKYSMMLDPPYWVVGGSDEGFHASAESQFYSFPNEYEDFYENEWFDFSGFVDDWVTYIHEPNTKTQQALVARPYMTRLATFVFPDQTKIDPVFNFNPDLGQVNHLYNLGRLGFECRGGEGGEYDELIAVVGLEGGQVIRYEAGGWGGSRAFRYGDSEVTPAAAHRIEQLNTSGPPVPVVLPRETAVLATDEQPVAARLTLSANRPNPFNSSTSVSYAIPAGTKRAALRVYNVLGQSVRTLVEQSVPATGSRTISWDGQTDAGTPVTSGMYLLALQADDKLLTRKIMLIR